jgi:Tol biopolymer transport system component
VNLDGTDLVRLTDHAERDDYPTWHPDGKSIAFVGERNGKFDLYSITVK